ncbi:MAG: hypothetical protein ACKODH_09265 [Limisphaerales bacterium]
MWTGYGFEVHKLHEALRAGKLTTAPGRVLEDASCFDDKGRELVLVVIDWPGFNDTAIKQGLNKWWTEKEKPLRPAPPVKRGQGVRHRKGLNAMLEDLGFARLRARYTPKQVFRHARKAWGRLLADSEKYGHLKPEFTKETLRAYEDAIRSSSNGVWKYFAEVFDFDHLKPKSQREFEARKTRTGPPKAAASKDSFGTG